MHARLALLVAAALPLGAACSPAPPPARSWPAGTVLAVDGVPVLGDEIDGVASWVSTVEPQAAPLHVRRLALTNVIFQRLAARDLSGDAWRAARQEAEATLARLRGEDRAPGPASEVEGEADAGSWQQLGLVVFGAALLTPPGTWSDVVESPGCFHLVQLDQVSEDGVVLQVRRIDFRYFPEERLGEVEERLDRARLTIVDEAWREAVPLSWVYRMRGESS